MITDTSNNLSLLLAWNKKHLSARLSNRRLTINRHTKLIFEVWQMYQLLAALDRSFYSDSSDINFINISSIVLEIWMFKDLILLKSFVQDWKHAKAQLCRLKTHGICCEFNFEMFLINSYQPCFSSSRLIGWNQFLTL